MKCIVGAKFTMLATVLNRYTQGDISDIDAGSMSGHWTTEQDEISGDITRVWVEDVGTPVLPGRDFTVGADRFDIECSARGFPEVGFRSSANTESFDGGRYLPMEMIQMIYPAKYILNRRQFVTNIRGKNRKILWVEEETGLPTVFEVQGVTPTFDPFGTHIDNLAVLKRAPIQ